jgi:hypothetical protein
MFGMTENSVTGATRPEKLAEVDEMWVYEEERRVRQQRLNRISRKVVAVFMAAALATLAYDSGHAAWSLHKYRPLTSPRSRFTPYLHGSWVYPATISTVSGLAALTILALAVKRRRRRGSHREIH